MEPVDTAEVPAMADTDTAPSQWLAIKNCTLAFSSCILLFLKLLNLFKSVRVQLKFENLHI
jgi:hypothetical protein